MNRLVSGFFLLLFLITYGCREVRCEAGKSLPGLGTSYENSLQEKAPHKKGNKSTHHHKSSRHRGRQKSKKEKGNPSSPDPGKSKAQ